MRHLMLAAALLLPGVAVAQDASPGQRVFNQCRACHTLNAGGRSGVGPNLHGLFGRRAGSIEGYAYGQSAGVFAVALQGDASVSNSGSIDVSSGGNVAVGVFARADYGTATAVNSGSIHATDFPGGYYTGYSAYGMFVRGERESALPGAGLGCGKE